MDEAIAAWHGIGFGDGEARTGDGLLDAKAFSEAANKGGFANTNVANELNDGWRLNFGGILSTKIEHFLF